MRQFTMFQLEKKEEPVLSRKPKMMYDCIHIVLVIHKFRNVFSSADRIRRRDNAISEDPLLCDSSICEQYRNLNSCI